MDGKPLLHQFAEELTSVIDRYRGEGLTIGEGIGAIEIAKLGLYLETQRDFLKQLLEDGPDDEIGEQQQ